MPVVQHTAALRGLRPVANAFGRVGVTDEQPRHRLVRGGGQLAHDPVHHGCLHLGHRLRVHRPQRQLVAVEVGVDVHSDGEQHGEEQRRPAEHRTDGHDQVDIPTNKTNVFKLLACGCQVIQRPPTKHDYKPLNAR